MRQEEARVAAITGYRVKIVERSGSQLRRILCKKDPFDRISCGRICMSCRNEKTRGTCRKRNITYMMSCDPCNEKEGEGDEVERGELAGSGGGSVYVGETYRSSFERGSEHISSYSARNETSHMWKHHTSKHQEEEEISFSMKVIKQHRSSFSRQTHEAVLIEMMDSGSVDILNSKGGFNRCSIPRLSVVLGDKEYQERPSTQPEITDTEVETVLTMRGRRTRVREAEDYQAPPNKRRNIKRNFSSERPMREAKSRSMEVEKRVTELQSRNSHLNFPSISKPKDKIKIKRNGLQRGSRQGNGSQVTTGHPPKNQKISFYFPRRNDTEQRFKRTEGR